MSEWHPIETAPRNVEIDVYGYRIQGQLAPGGPYRYYYVTVGEISDGGTCYDYLESGRNAEWPAPEMEHPTHWRERPKAPQS